MNQSVQYTVKFISWNSDLCYCQNRSTNNAKVYVSMNIYIYMQNSQIIVEMFIQASSVQLLSRVRLFATPWAAARQVSLSITNSRNLLKLMSIESVIPSNHLIFYRPLLLLPSIPPSIRVFSNESTICKLPRYCQITLKN